MDLNALVPMLNSSVQEQLHTEEYDLNKEMEYISARYRAEEQLLSSIASGKEDAAFQAFYAYGELMQAPQQKAAPTSADPFRDFKNSVLVMNTLFRKAVEQNYVHPIYIHESSSRLGEAIERAPSEDALIDLIREMVVTYCRLVRDYSLATYTEPIRKAILFIDLHISSPISTRDLAQDQFLTPNYLSARFKQEVGVNISDYILHRKINLAAQILISTHLSVQEIASRVGIDDASYFSKQFKRLKGLSPLQYRAKERSRQGMQRKVD